jgi:hypothetical protein
MGRSHFGQREGGDTTDKPAGHRAMQTFKNDPMQRPTRNAPMVASAGLMSNISVTIAPYVTNAMYDVLTMY